MRLSYLHLQNICQFAEFSYSFSPGITTVLGANGAGKSNLMNVGILGGLFGDWKLIGRKVSQICSWDGFEGQPAQIDLELILRGEEVRISRTIAGKNTEHRLWYKGEEISGASQVLSCLEELGIYPNFFVEVCYCPQGAASWYFQTSPQEHRRRLDQVLGLAEAEYIRKQLKEGAIQIKRKIPSFLDPEQIRQSLNSCEQAISEVTTQLSQLPTVQGKIAEYNKIVGEIGEIKGKLSQVQAVRKLAEIEKKREQIADRLRWVEQIILQYKDKLGTPAVTLEKDLSLWRSLVLEASKQIAQLESNNVNTNRLPRLLKLHGAVAGRLRLLKRIIENPHECPTCKYKSFSIFNTPINKAQYRKYQRINKRLIEQIFRLAMQEGARIQEEQAEQEQFQAQLARIEEFERKYGDFKKLERLIKRSHFYQFRLPVIRHQLQESLNSLSAGRTVAETQQVQFTEEELRRQLQEKTQLAEKLRQEADRERKVINRREFLQGQLKSLQEQKKGIEQSLAKALKLQQKSQHLGVWQERLETLAELFSPQHLPSYYRERKLLSVIRYANEMLEEMNVTWRVVGAESYWEIKDQRGHLFPASFLSGGQRVLLIMALKFAMMRLFPQRSGLLILDEPFDGLDEENLQALLQQFEQVKSWVGEHGFQLIMSTHHHLVSQLGDHCLVIDHTGAKHETSDLLAS